MDLDRLLAYIQESRPEIQLGEPNSIDMRSVDFGERGLSLRSFEDFVVRGLGFEEEELELPVGLKLLEGLALTRVVYGDRGDGRSGLASIGLAWDEVDWPGVMGLLQTKRVQVSVFVRWEGDERTVQVHAQWVGALAGSPFVIGVGFPSGDVALSIAGQEPVRVGGLLEHFQLPSAGFEKLEVAEIQLVGNVRSGFLDAHLTVLDPWQSSGFAVRGIELTAFRVAEEVSGEIAGVAEIGSGNSITEIRVGANHEAPNDGWILEGSVQPTGDHTRIEDLVAALHNQFPTTAPFELPELLSGMQVSDLGLRFNTASKDLTFHLAVRMTSLNPAPEARLEFEVTHPSPEKTETKLGGELRLGGADHPQVFRLAFERDKAGVGKTSTMLGVYANPGGTGASLADLLAPLVGSNENVQDILEGVRDFRIKSALFAHQSERRFLFTAEMDFGIDLSGLGKLPLIGRALSSVASFSVAFQPIFGSKAKPAEMAAIAALAPDGAPKLPASAPAGFDLLTTLKIGDTQRELGLGLDKNEATDHDGLGSTVDADDPVDAGASMARDDVSWIDLQKHFGPLHLERAGFAFANRRLTVALDAELSVGPLAVAVEGLGASYDLKTKGLSFSLRALGLDFHRESIELEGVFLRMPNDEFAGMAKLKLKKIALGAIGAYGEHTDQETGTRYPSLFIYAYLNTPLGGPGFFFVEGLAAGFGLNRTLTVPPVGEIQNFPLIAEVIGTVQPAQTGDPFENLRQEFASLERYVAPRLGQYWFAVGVKFTTYKQIDSFALVSVSFGKHFELDVLGISRLQLPANSSKVLAVIELAFAARLSPEEGFLSVQARLTRSSWILSPEARLQGGFAFSSWFLGEHAGDFVYTFGGYHPHFAVPAHYPRVPRLGFDWKIDSHTEIKGEAYFALTSTAVMAGGSLAATWHNSWVEAWFNLGADFLMQWKPYHYEASMHVDMGARVTIHFFGTHHLNFHAGADLSIWGPEFAGKARVSVTVIGFHVHFTVDFGGGKAPAKKIGWKEFSESFLPKEEDRVTLAIQKGLLRTLKEETEGAELERWVLNAKQFDLAIESAIPSTLPFTKDLDSPAPASAQNLNPEQRQLAQLPPLLGIEPMGVPRGNSFNSQLEIGIGLEGAEGEVDVTEDFDFHPVTKRVPAALWSPDATPTSRPNPNADELIGLSGYTLHPKPAPPTSKTHSIRSGNLSYEETFRPLPTENARALHYAPLGVDESGTSEARRAALELAMVDPERAARRAEFLSPLGFERDRFHLRETTAAGYVQVPHLVRTEPLTS